MTAPMDGASDNPRLAQEARLLVTLLRSSRLFLLFGEPGSEKSAFLQTSLLPLLQRRTDDKPSPAHVSKTGVVVPFPDQRARAGSERRKREVVVLFDDWSGAPLPALDAHLRRAASSAEPCTDTFLPPLADSIVALSERFNIQFIIILDRFEEFLRLPAERDGITEFTDALTEALNVAQLPASFLLSMEDDARASLSGLRRRVPGFDDFSLRLPGIVAAVKAPPISAATEHEVATLTQRVAAPGPRLAPQATADAPPHVMKPPTPVRAPVKTQDVYALIEDTLIRTASDNDCEPFQGSQPGALLPDRVVPPPTPPLRKPKRVKNSGWPEEFKAEPAPPPAESPRQRPRRRPKPTLIGRCKALFSRWRGSGHQTD